MPAPLRGVWLPRAAPDPEPAPRTIRNRPRYVHPGQAPAADSRLTSCPTRTAGTGGPVTLAVDPGAAAASNTRMTSATRAAACLALTSILGLGGCAEPPAGPPALVLHPVTFAEIAGWPQDPVGEILRPLLAECERLGRLPADTRLGGQGEAETAAGRAGLYAPACRAARALPSSDTPTVRRYLETWFLPYEASDRSVPDASLTGYFEPEIPGALGRSADNPVPVLGRPDDLLTVPSSQPGQPAVTGRRQGGQVVPYWTRAQIDNGALGGRNLEILWLHSPVDLFFLQV